MQQQQQHEQNVNTNTNPKSNSNILFTPTYPNQSQLNQTSMIEYSKIVCCLCSAIIPANPTAICETCQRKNINLTNNFPTTFTLIYCRSCGRYNRPPWIKCELESQDMMNLCISRIKNLNKAKIIDSSFIWTEPHSRIIKVKITLQKEIDKIIATQSTVLTYKIETQQCFDCTKSQTPHFWYASVQLRQKVSHKKTFMYIEQCILKHKMHRKALKITEHPDGGVDFFFWTKNDAMVFCDFISGIIPVKVKVSKHVVSHSNQQHIFVVDIAAIWKGDLVLLNDSTSKSLGGIGPVMLCDRVSSKIRLIDPRSFESVEFDGNSFFKYDFKTGVDTKCMKEFLIIDIEEEVDYTKRYKNTTYIDNNNNNNEPSSIASDSIVSKSTNYGKNVIDNENEYINEKEKAKNYIVKCMRNDSNDCEQDKRGEVIELRCPLAMQMKPGDVYYGYDMSNINVSSDLEMIIEKNAHKIPDVVLVRKKKEEKDIVKLKRLDVEKEEGYKKKGKKEKNGEDKEYEEFVEEIMENEDMKKNVVLEGEGDDNEDDDNEHLNEMLNEMNV